MAPVLAETVTAQVQASATTDAGTAGTDDGAALTGEARVPVDVSADGAGAVAVIDGAMADHAAVGIGAVTAALTLDGTDTPTVSAGLDGEVTAVLGIIADGGLPAIGDNPGSSDLPAEVLGLLQPAGDLPGTGLPGGVPGVGLPGLPGLRAGRTGAAPPRCPAQSRPTGQFVPARRSRPEGRRRAACPGPAPTCVSGRSPLSASSAWRGLGSRRRRRSA